MAKGKECITSITYSQAKSGVELIDMFRENFSIDDNAFRVSVGALRKTLERCKAFMEKE